MIQQRTCRQPNDAHRPSVGLRSQSCRGGVDLEEERGHLTSQLRARDSGRDIRLQSPDAQAHLEPEPSSRSINCLFRNVWSATEPERSHWHSAVFRRWLGCDDIGSL